MRKVLWNLRSSVDRAFDQQSKAPGLVTQRSGSVPFFTEKIVQILLIAHTYIIERSLFIFFSIRLLLLSDFVRMLKKKESTLNFSQIGQYLPTKHGPWNFPWDLHRRNHAKTKNLHHFFNVYSSYCICVDENLHGMLKISS